jgi:hypothetical protein
VKRDYEGLPYDALARMADNGDKEAHLELARRHTESANQPEPAAGAAPPQQLPGVILSKDPVPRSPWLWIAFIVFLLWKKTRVLIEPAGICMLLYAIYILARKIYFTDRYWPSSVEMAGTYIFTLLVLVGLSKIANIWLHMAWQNRPLTVFLVIGGVVCWYDGVWPL